jgi:hypothetical protein
LVLIASEAQAGERKAAGVIPPQAHFRGLSFGEWAAKWWQAAYSLPVVEGEHPLISGGAFGGDKGVLFLAGTFTPTVIELTIPAGTPLFFPVINVECSVIEPDPFHGDDEQSLRQCANNHIDQTSARFATLDSTPINLSRHRVESPLFEFGPLPEDNYLGAPAGATSLAVDAGYYVMLAPLSVGEHVLHFGGTSDEFGVAIETMYLITVVDHAD